MFVNLKSQVVVNPSKVYGKCLGMMSSWMHQFLFPCWIWMILKRFTVHFDVTLLWFSNEWAVKKILVMELIQRNRPLSQMCFFKFQKGLEIIQGTMIVNPSSKTLFFLWGETWQLGGVGVVGARRLHQGPWLRSVVPCWQNGWMRRQKRCMIALIACQRCRQRGSGATDGSAWWRCCQFGGVHHELIY